MNIKRIIPLLLIVILVLFSAACVAGMLSEPTSPDNQMQGGEGPGSGDKPEEPELIMPAAPTDALAFMEYNAAYNTLTDVTEKVGTAIIGFPSKQAVTLNSVTEFTTQAEAEAFIKDFADVGYTGDITATIDENGCELINYWTAALAGNNRYFFLANSEFSAQKLPKILKTMYDGNTDTLYVMLDYYPHFYGEFQQSQWNVKEIANNSVATYEIVALNLDNLNEQVEHIAFVTPEKKAICREDINVSVIPYDEQYKNLTFFDYENDGVDPRVYNFPSTQKPTENKVELVTSKDAYLAFHDEYNDIINRDEDTVIFETYVIEHTHRAIGLQNASENEMLNIFISSPELDPYSTLYCKPFWFEIKGQIQEVPCGEFYDESTQTVYIYLGYNGQPLSTYESPLDEKPINEKSQASYAVMSIDFCDEAINKVKNVVIVLPDPATVPSK